MISTRQSMDEGWVSVRHRKKNTVNADTKQPYR